MRPSLGVLLLIPALGLLSYGTNPPSERTAAIQRDVERIRNECKTYGGGDWGAWFAKLAPFRLELRAKIEAAKPNNPSAEGTFVARAPVIEAVGSPPLFEGGPAGFLSYLYAPDEIDRWVESRPSVQAIASVSSWLRKRGVDVIFVPVPKMTEVYADRVVSSVPREKIVAPQNRRLILKLLEADVEVVDLLPLFLAARDTSPEPLYYPADTHWSGTGRLIAVREIGKRLRRYDFVRKALAGPRIFAAKEVNPFFQGAVYAALTQTQKSQVDKWTRLSVLSITPLTEKPVIADDSPVLLTGDSYCVAMPELMANEINLPVSDTSVDGQIGGAIKDFLRDPTLLNSCRVVIWINEAANFTADGWQIPPVIQRKLQE